MVANPYEQFLPPGMTPEQAARFLPQQQPSPNDLYAVSPPEQPDLRLASNDDLRWSDNRAPFLGSTKQPAPEPSRADFTPSPEAAAQFENIANGAQLATNRAANFNNLADRLEATPAPIPEGTPQQNVNPADLVGPGQEAGEAAGKTRTPMDNAYFADLLQASRGTPGRVVKGGPTLASETWTQQGERAIPGGTVEDIGEPEWRPVMKPGPKGKLIRVMEHDPETGKMVPKMELYQPKRMVPNQENYQGKEALANEAQADIEGQQQGAMRREAGRELYAGSRVGEEAQLERERLARAEQRYEELQALREQAIRQTLAELPKLSQQHSPDSDTQSRLGLGIAQGMLWMGAALAGQQPPHINMMQDAIDNDLKRQQMQMQKGFGKINALGQLTQQLGDPIAAAHAFQAMRWENVKHELEGLAHRGAGGVMSDNAQAMWHQADLKAVENSKAAYGGAYQKVIATQPDQYVPGRAGGLPAMIAELQRQLKGSPKETIDKATNDLINAVQSGQPFRFPNGASAPLTTGGERHSQFNNAIAVAVPSWMGTGTSVVHYRTPKEAEDAADTVELVEGVRHTIQETRDLVKQFGSSWSPEQRAKINTNLTMEGEKISRALKMPATEKSAEAAWKMIGADVALSRISPVNFNEVADNLERNLIVFGRALAHVHQATSVPRGQETGEGYLVPNK